MTKYFLLLILCAFTVNPAWAQKDTASSILYYPNGKFYNKITTEIKLKDTIVSYEECRDSTGKVLTAKGNGDWITFDRNFAHITGRGRVKNYKPDSLWTFGANSRNSYTVIYNDGKELSREVNNNIYTFIRDVPAFPGGLDALHRFLADNVRYPRAEAASNIRGMVVVAFIVEKDGSLSNIHIMRGLGGAFDLEALRVAGLSPKWKPATLEGKAKPIQYFVRIDFLSTTQR